MKSIKEYFKSKTPEQTLTFCLLVGCVILMLFCAIVRLCGGLWFSADLSSVKVPSEFWQDFIMKSLFLFEATLVYKILCQIKWIFCFILSLLQACIIQITINYIPNYSIFVNIINLLCYLLVPLAIKRKWIVLVDGIFLYLANFLYSLIFLAGRIGGIDPNSAYNFVYNILGVIDYKLFFVAMYLFQKNFGGFKLWKKQKRLICQKDL